MSGAASHPSHTGEDCGRALSASANGWMRPEIYHNMAGPLSLADEVKRGGDTKIEERSQVSACEGVRVDHIT